MTISSSKSALLFDIDGTLADTDVIHLKAFNQVFGEYGHNFDGARYKQEIQGFTNQSIGDRFFPTLSNSEKKAITDKKEEVFREMAHEGLKPLGGLIPLMDWADKNNIPMAAVTNAPRANADHILNAIGVYHRFKTIVIAGELAHGKPHPLPYLEGLSRLGAMAERSIAFEDSRTGLQSCLAAGIQSVGIMTSLTPDEMAQTGAHYACKDYNDDGLWAIIEEKFGIKASKPNQP